MTLLPELFQPMQVGPMQVANRLMMSGMSAGMMADENGEVAPETVAYFVERARSCPGMMALGATSVVPLPPGVPRRGIVLSSDDIIPSLRRLTDAVHQFDTKLGVQLWNGGGTEGYLPELISPSGLSSNVRNARDGSGRKRPGQINRALEIEEIPGVIKYFADAAVRCEKAGFDFIEIHAGHGYLISNFMTPLFNRRTDRYGGSFENRVRFLLELLDAVKGAVSGKMGVGVKFNGDDFIGDDGWTVADSCKLAPLLEAGGSHYITVTAGVVGAPRLTIPPMYEPQGCYTFLAEQVKPFVKGIPVGTVGRVKDPRMAHELVSKGKVDFVCMGRPLIADPDIIAKTRRGELEDIRPCLADCRGCADEHVIRGNHASCVVNPRMGRELHLIDIEGASKDNPKNILVVGGGLAGLEAARRAAFSGHKVTLCETRSWLGGQIRLAAMMPKRSEIADMMPWYERQMAKHGVDVRLNTTVDEALIKSLAPDVVIVATGSQPEVPQNMLDAVMSAANVEIMMLDEMLEQKLEAGTKVLVIGGDQNGILAADYLSEGGREVWIAESHGHFGEKLAAHDRWYVLNRVNEKSVHRIKNVHGVEVGGNDDVWLVTESGRELLPGVDTIVFASDRRANRGVAEITNKLGIETHLVGDAYDATSEHSGTIFANIARAYDVARRL
ncbi:MAG: FAD-dependent oxidoreductase [Hyphomonadaceae bacterium]